MLDQNNVKLGYIPEADNIIFSRLMDKVKEKYRLHAGIPSPIILYCFYKTVARISKIIKEYQNKPDGYDQYFNVCSFPNKESAWKESEIIE